MKIAVIGAGAMGSLFGAHLAESGEDVHLIDVWQEHVEAVNRSGVMVESANSRRVVSVSATTNPADVGTVALTIIFVKSTQTAAAAETAAGIIGTDGTVLTLQNGMGNADIISGRIDPGRIIAGTTSHGATLLAPGTIRHAGAGPTVIGPWSPGIKGMQRAEKVASVLSRAGIATDVVEDIRPVVWAKLLINVGINAITGLTGIKNGQLLDLEVTRNLSRAAVAEAVQVAHAQGVRVRNDATEHVFQIAAATAANRSSMGQDVDRKRTTEIDAINGYIVREAERFGIEAPVNKTLTALIKTLESHYIDLKNSPASAG